MRKPWPEYFMDIAKAVATRATCDRKHVGAVIVRDNRILSTGYNGSIPGAPHCDDVGHMMEDGHCVAGSTVISKFQTGRYNTGHRTIEEIYTQWQHPQKRGAMLRMNIRSMAPTGVIVPDRITDVWSRGAAETFRVKTGLGRETVVTSEHLLATPSGWKPLQELATGSKVGLNGQALVDDAVWLRTKYCDEGLTQLQIAALAGVSRQVVSRRLAAAGVEKRDFQLGGWNTGFQRTASHSYKGSAVKPNVARSRARRYALQDTCQVCGVSGDRQVHHVDENVYNDADSNLITLCIPCHTLAHTAHAKRESVVYDPIVSIVPAGVQPVFDLTVAHNANFVGDGFILHNCVRTVHAEANAIMQAARHGVRLDGGTIYTTASPCWPCFQKIVTAGIKTIVFGELYRDARIHDFAEQSGIELVDMSKRDG